jgi:hypothetical protein
MTACKLPAHKAHGQSGGATGRPAEVNDMTACKLPAHKAHGQSGGATGRPAEVNDSELVFKYNGCISRSRKEANR